MDIAYEQLRTAIVKTAARDYKRDYEKFLKHPTVETAGPVWELKTYFEDDCAGFFSCGRAIRERIENKVRRKYSSTRLILSHYLLETAGRLYEQEMEKESLSLWET